MYANTMEALDAARCDDPPAVNSDMDPVSDRPMTADDAEAVLRIYQEGIDTGHATFAPAAPGWDDWHRTHLEHSRIVALIGSEIAGWAALSPVSARAVYRGVAEISLYVAAWARGRGIGRRLMQATIESSEAAGIWTLQASIFRENRASIALHEAADFWVLGVRRKIGRMERGPFAGCWRDVLLMERRSLIVGLE